MSTPTRDEIDLDAEVRAHERAEESASAGLLERVAITLSSTLDLKEVLRRLAGMVQEATSAQRCTIVLIDGDRLTPAVAIGDRPDEDLWRTFRSIDPIELGGEHWALINDGRAVAFDDARESPFIPRPWVEHFDLRAVAAVPLVAHGEPIGVMAVDWPEVRHVSAADLGLLEAIGTYAGLAVRNARLHEHLAAKSTGLERLVEVGSALNSSSSLSEVLGLICTSFEDLLRTAHCSVNLTDPTDPLRLHTLASRGQPWFERRAHGSDAVVPEELCPPEEARHMRAGPIVYPQVGSAGGDIRAPEGIRSAALFPLFGADGLVGFVVTGFSSLGGPDEHESDTGQTLAEMAAAAISRADLHEHLRRRMRQLEMLSRLSEVVTGTASLDELLDEVADGLTADLGMSLDALVIADPGVRSTIGGGVPGLGDEQAIRAWHDEPPSLGVPRLRTADDAVLVPVVHCRRVLGALRVRVGDEALTLPDEEFLLAIGAACAEVVHRAMIGRTLAESERRVAVVAERERIARDLHDSVGHLVSGMGMKLAGYLDDVPDDRWRRRLTTLLRVAQQADREVRDAVHSLVFVEVRRDGLVQSLYELARRFSATTGIEVAIDVDHEPVDLPPDHEDVLFRAAHEALSNTERHAEAASAAVTLTRGREHVCVGVEDDGVGMLEPGAAATPRLHFGLRAVDRRLRELGGSLTLRHVEPHGTRVEATLPVRDVGRRFGTIDRA